ncbi:lipid II:glycine glycyltransferase (peptidoglycan interpeptide bridge formation enzyme) [Motilibacter rhizosphaerae]|uniref:Lipid II:glycine glycyltransferase (Peptidoglycan interpeptide bridge formation enzyme) n=1 Tax=Motilibacter rhizosphaerae TaxID=598652 RepID=A0A4Q7NVA6_9ACTN|nr:peptidoglycan bridge formation glycyltransferase FemA/FemB family protein [Motilibacter rhizosphaerae]RZS91171.1 lipid II:glycine glycyltransferase (peptidoglycan interpeptide bridge formation enzyme) [Motilibacter rhizosphaerae]
MLVRPVLRDEHLAFVAERGSASFLQLPSWAGVKTEWGSESLGWFDDAGVLRGVGLVLHRRLPRLGRSLAYLPEGPVLDWAAVAADPAAWLDPLVAHLRRKGAFGVRMGPPVVTRRWGADVLKAAIAAGGAGQLADVVPTSVDALGTQLTTALRAAGWRAPQSGHGFRAGQPQYVFQLPLAGRTEDDVLRGFNQLWRRNIKKAEKAGVTVETGTTADLPAFHALYVETARRDGFTPRPLAYFERMFRAMDDEDPERITLLLARREGVLLAATTLVRVGRHAWYSYGASSTEGREHRGSNAVQWEMVRRSLAAGCEVYDLRGITDTIAESDPHFGLIQFKLGTGGEAVEYVGEWDLPLNRLLYKAFDTYMSRRG